MDACCEHCGTRFEPKREDERYCCHGCEFVAELIAENGFERFYDLKRDSAVAPVRSRPFEEHDFTWVAEKVARAERLAAERGRAAELELALEGISCVGCVWLVERLFSRHPGGIRAVAQPAGGRLHLEWRPGDCDLTAFLQELVRFGYVAAPAGALAGDHERRRLGARLGLCGAFAMNAMAFMLPSYLGMPADFEFAPLFLLIAFVSSSLAMIVGGGYFIERAWRALRAGSLHIDLPIGLGLIAAYCGSIVGWILGVERLIYFEFVATFVFLMLAGRYVQTAAVDRNRRRLVRAQPVPEVVSPVAEGAAPVARDAIAPGLRFRFEPGRALPVGATLVSGAADVSLEWIHGEPEPLRVPAGRRLPAGAILLSREPVTVEAGERWEDSLMAKLIAAPVAERGSPGLDRLLRTYLSVVIVIGLAALLGWGVFGNDWLTGLQAMISVFVVSCPCALGVAIPLADDLAASAMARLGVFTRSATLWPRLMRVRQVLFDKTGTLTLERPELAEPDAVGRLDDEAALALARLTRGSLHPVSRSLLEALGHRGQSLLDGSAETDPQETPGLGVELADETGLRWSLGRAGWRAAEGEAAAAAEGLTELRREGRLVAAFAFRESLRPGAAETVKRLARMGLGLRILSGDHPRKVARLAELLGIPAHAASGGLSPEDKAREVSGLDRADSLYLGDGANDSLAFDAALVTGTPVVDRSLLESKADFYTLGAGLGFLPALFAAARARSTGVRRAFCFALIYNLSTVSVAASGHMSPLLAAILMPLSSLVSVAIVAGAARRARPIPSRGGGRAIPARPARVLAPGQGTA